MTFDDQSTLFSIEYVNWRGWWNHQNDYPGYGRPNPGETMSAGCEINEIEKTLNCFNSLYTTM